MTKPVPAYNLEITRGLFERLEPALAVVLDIAFRHAEFFQGPIKDSITSGGAIKERSSLTCKACFRFTAGASAVVDPPEVVLGIGSLRAGAPFPGYSWSCIATYPSLET